MKEGGTYIMSINARDIAQRSIGCIGFSALAHTTLIAALLLAPKSATDLGNSVAEKQKLFDGEGSVEVIAAQNQEAAPAKAEVKVEIKAEAEIETAQTTSVPAPVPQKAVEELPPPKKIAEVAAPKPVKTKVIVKTPAAPKIKTTAESDVVTESEDRNVELENLSPVIAEQPLEPSSDDAAAPTPTEAPAAESSAPVQASSETKEKEAEPSAPAAAPAAVEKPAPPPQAATEPKDDGEGRASSSGSSNTASTAAAAANGKSDAESSGPGSSASGSGDGQIIEASLRRPLPGNQLPQYPRQDRLMRREGTSIVLGDVRHNGTVENVRLERSAGSKEMDSAAIAAFKKWKFAPGAEATVRKSFRYALQGPEQVNYTSLKR